MMYESGFFLISLLLSEYFWEVMRRRGDAWGLAGTKQWCAASFVSCQCHH